MTVDECMAKATAAIDEAIAAAMDQGIKLIYDRGATEEEVASFCEWYGQLLADDRINKLANVRARLQRDGEPLQ